MVQTNSASIKVTRWYAVQVSDTTMMSNEQKVRSVIRLRQA